MISVFDLFTIGIGPSSSHTVGPMRAARRFVQELEAAEVVFRVTRISVGLHGSLAATGVGHGTPGAVLLGLEGAVPESIDPETARERIGEIERDEKILLAGRTLALRPADDIVVAPEVGLLKHPNAMTLHAWGGSELLFRARYYSVGGGFVVAEDEAADPAGATDGVPHMFQAEQSSWPSVSRLGCRLPTWCWRMNSRKGVGKKL